MVAIASGPFADSAGWSRPSPPKRTQSRQIDTIDEKFLRFGEVLEGLTDAEIESRLAAAPPERWAALSEARAAFDAEESHGRWEGGTGDPIQMPWVDYAPAADGLVTAIYALGASGPFDWHAWDGLNRYPHGEGLADAPVAEAIRMVTAIVRADRFSEGTKLAFFDDGTFRIIVDRLHRWHAERARPPPSPAPARVVVPSNLTANVVAGE